MQEEAGSPGRALTDGAAVGNILGPIGAEECVDPSPRINGRVDIAMHAPTAPMTPSTIHCIFCDLMRGAAEVSICYEDATAIAFLDIQPVNPGHVLVVPRAHYATLQDIPADVGAHLYKVATKLIPFVQTASGATDMNIVVNSGAAAGQNVMHYHIHLIPRRAGDGFDIPLPFSGSAMPNRQQLDAMAARIGSMLRDPLRDGGMKA